VSLPALIRPMLATAGQLPVAGQQDAWAFEMKWDGVRAIAYVRGPDPGDVLVLGRNDRDATATYPEVRDIGAAVGGRPCILDGEIVAFAPATGRPDFGTLQQRMHVVGAAQVRTLMRTVPVVFLVFDVLHLDGRSLLDVPYDQRRAHLDTLALAGARWQVPPAFLGGGAHAFTVSAAQGLEGVVAKRRDSRYEPGRRSACWIKVKNVFTQDVVVGGWKPGQGRRAGGIGSLLLGIPGSGGLEFIGHVGTGFTAATLADLAGRLAALERRTSVFREVPAEHARVARWVEPRLVGEVEHRGWTGEGRLRQPSWRGLRPDRPVTDVVRE
jgi:bifunctional non-homologous end joining protein LigD